MRLVRRWITAVVLATLIASAIGAQQQWIDDPVVPGETPIKAVHLQEVHRRIDALRQERGLPRATHTDPPRPGRVIRASDFAQAVSALAAVYRADGAEPPQYGRIEGGEPIRAFTINVLRAAIVSREGGEVARWRGLEIAAEERCAPYDSDDYPYPQSVEDQIIAQLGGSIYSPYTCESFDSKRETDIEHIVARSEAHDSGLCDADAATKRRFASDLLNLTLASPELNRVEKSGKDAAEWQPEHNQCWFAQRVIDVRMAYGLTIDRVEADAVDRILAGCTSTEIACEIEPPEPEPEAEPEPEPVPDHPPIQSFRNCTLMRGAGWTRGVNISGGTYRPEWNDAERQTYQLNTGSDRDRDGHACE